MDINREQNEKIIAVAENSLFTTFTKDIAEKVSVSPKYCVKLSSQLPVALLLHLLLFAVF